MLTRIELLSLALGGDGPKPFMPVALLSLRRLLIGELASLMDAITAGAAELDRAEQRSATEEIALLMQHGELLMLYQSRLAAVSRVERDLALWNN
jgi:hypothetical protein